MKKAGLCTFAKMRCSEPPCCLGNTPWGLQCWRARVLETDGKISTAKQIKTAHRAPSDRRFRGRANKKSKLFQQKDFHVCVGAPNSAAKATPILSPFGSVRTWTHGSWIRVDFRNWPECLLCTLSRPRGSHSCSCPPRTPVLHALGQGLPPPAVAHSHARLCLFPAHCELLTPGRVSR